MRKRTGTIAMIAAVTSIAFYSLTSQKEETAHEISLQVTVNQVSDVPITLVDIIDGDTIKVNV
jgi:micrococcal nuclease